MTPGATACRRLVRGSLWHDGVFVLETNHPGLTTAEIVQSYRQRWSRCGPSTRPARTDPQDAQRDPKADAIDCRQIVRLFVSALVLEAPECAAPLLAK